MKLTLLSVLFTSFLAMTSMTIAASVNINKADANHLETAMVGIGSEKAAAIIQYRDEHGPFTSIDDLAKVKGVGEKTIEKNRDSLTVSE